MLYTTMYSLSDAYMIPLICWVLQHGPQVLQRVLCYIKLVDVTGNKQQDGRRGVLNN